MNSEQQAGIVEPRVTGRAVLFTLLSLFVASAICGMLIMAALAVINVGGYCAEGGPYVIAQHCPRGSAVVLSAGIPLLFLVGFLYVMAKPLSWPPTIGWLWPVMFVGMAIAFFIGAANAPGEIGWVGIITGIVMLAIGLAPAFLFAGRSRDSSSRPLGERLRGPEISQAVVLLAGVGFGIWAWSLIG